MVLLGSYSLLNYKKPENNIVQIKGVFNDPSGGYSGSQNVLLRRQILRVSDTSQVRQEAATFKLVFPFIIRVLNSFNRNRTLSNETSLYESFPLCFRIYIL